MHDNLPTNAGPAFGLPDYAVIELSGRDSAAFAQAQFMNDVAALPVGHWHWSGWLTPKGRVLALFAVLKLADERLWLLLPDVAPATVAAALQRYVFRAKVTIRARGDLHVRGRFTAPPTAAGSAVAGDEATGIELDLSGAGGMRCVQISEVLFATNAAHVARWAAFDLEHGLPRLPPSQIEHWTPQQLSLERLQAFSIKKGCYPGQEIVARTHFLGKAKRGLTLVESAAPLATGAELRSTDAAIGNVVAAASADGRHVALAVVPLERAAVPLSVEGLAAHEIPLRGGLAR
jgi:tRNA-modifying protein YgfZ